MSNNSLIPVLANKLPEFVRDDYPKFVEYIKDYLEFLEQDDNFLGIANSWRENLEPSLKVEPYITALLTDLGFEAGQNLAIDKNLLIHMLKEFYSSRGNEASFRFLFRMLFNADVSIRYPRDRMLIPSYAEYGERHFIFTTAGNLNTVDFTNLVLDIRSNGGSVQGLTSDVVASVENIQIMHGSGTPYFQIEILRPNFEFIIGEAVVIRSEDLEISEFVQPVLAIDVISAGSGYKAGDAIQVTGAALPGYAYIESTKKGGVSALNITAPGTGYVVGDLIKADSIDDGFGFSASVQAIDGSGGITQYKVNNQGYNYETLPDITISEGLVSATVLAQSNSIGAVQTIKMENPFIDFDTPSITIVSEMGSGAVLQARQISRWETKDWADRKGFLEENSTLIDSDKVQQFSYTIVSSVASKQYEAYVNDYLHPVGYIKTSSYEIVSHLALNITAGDLVAGGEEAIIYSSVMSLTFLSESDIFQYETIGTDDGLELVTNLDEPIITST